MSQRAVVGVTFGAQACGKPWEHSTLNGCYSCHSHLGPLPRFLRFSLFTFRFSLFAFCLLFFCVAVGRCWTSLATEGPAPFPRDSHVAAVHGNSMYGPNPGTAVFFGTRTSHALNECPGGGGH